MSQIFVRHYLLSCGKHEIMFLNIYSTQYSFIYVVGSFGSMRTESKAFWQL